MVVVAPSRNWVRRVRRFVQPPATSRCELCGAAIPDDHAHVVDISEQRLCCACARCESAVAPGGPYRRLPRSAHALAGFVLTDAEWESLQIPIGLAFIFHSTPRGRPVAEYPGPMGATESLLGLEPWSGIVAQNPVLTTLLPDVEALLINRTHGRRDYYRVPIDCCYALAGLIRRHWKGMAGGSEAWEAIDEFFDRLRRSVAGDRAHG